MARGIIVSKKHIHNGVEYKSNLEYFFCLYLEELVKAGFVSSFSYESKTYQLSKTINLPYKKQMRTKIRDSEEFIMRECTYTPDFIIEWTRMARNVFYLDRNSPIELISEIPFRLVNNYGKLLSAIEIKPINESKLNSSVEFPAMQKWVFQKYGHYVQKIKPYDSNGKGCLFEKTFTPKEVIDSEIYQVNCKGGLKGSSKLKYKANTLEEYLKFKKYE